MCERAALRSTYEALGLARMLALLSLKAVLLLLLLIERWSITSAGRKL